MIAVIDYGMGNLRSVQKAFESIGAEARITSSPNVIRNAEKLVLPGVGEFGNAMEELKKKNLVKIIRDIIKEGRVFLGLCLGMQLLFEESEEALGVRGLCILKGRIKRFKNSPGLKIPHMGWNCIKLKVKSEKLKVLNEVRDGSYMYFVHSYYAAPKDSDIVVGCTNYGIDFPAIICKDNIYAMQFHPEKSQALGLRIIENFVKLC